MPTIRISSLTEGATLAQDVMDMKGHILLKRGICVNEKHIKLCKSWGVTEVEVTGSSSAAGSVSKEESTPEGATRNVEQDKAETELRPLFMHNDLSQPMMHEFFDLCVLRKAKMPW